MNELQRGDWFSSIVSSRSRARKWRKIREVEGQAAEEADRRFREIITLALERIASEHVSEFSVSSVDLPPTR